MPEQIGSVSRIVSALPNGVQTTNGQLATKSTNGHSPNGNGRTKEPVGPKLESIRFIHYPHAHREITDRLLYIGTSDGPVRDATYSLESLIHENVIGRNNAKRGEEVAREVRAFVSSLSDFDKVRFDQIVQSCEKHKNRIKYVIFAGGGFRVVAESAASIAINTILELIGRTYATEEPNVEPMTYIATSGGAYQAMALAARATNSKILSVTTNSDFTQFIDSPENIQDWCNKHLKRAIFHITGKEIAGDVMLEHLLQFGSNLQVVVGERKSKWVYFFIPHLFPQDLEKLGIDPKTIAVKQLIWATSNHPKLYPNHTCTIETKDGRTIPLCDPGLFQRSNLYIAALIDEIKSDRPDKPFGFVVGNRVANNDANGTLVKLTRYADKVLGDTLPTLTKHGAQRTFIEVGCEGTHTNGNSLHLDTLGFDTHPLDRETIIAHQIPTKEFPRNLNSTSSKNLKDRSVMDQLYTNLVENGGLDAYFREIDEANNPPRNNSAGSSFWARWGLGKSAAAAL